MVFSSYLFLFYFLPAALLVYYTVPRRAKLLALTAASYLFYGWANPLFTILLLVSTLVDYCVGLFLARGGVGFRLLPSHEASAAGGLGRSRADRLALVVSICTNLGLLGFFKYFNFGAESFDGLVTWLGVEELRLDIALKVTLPLGISFYTFQSMSYTIDVYRRHTAPVRSFIDFACYVSMFPQLVAGPIIRYSEVADQLRERTHTLVKFARGVAFFCLGMTKKVLLANPCGQIADLVFDGGSVRTLDAWYGVTAYAFQIYFDFSGYSDMAIGLGLMLGFVFPKNFDSPYLAQSITEFWQRWHISLSTWLRTYLYVPLGGNRKGPRRTYANLAIVMLLGGLWHGAAWNFVVWGGIHGAALALERVRRKRSLSAAWPKPVRVAAMFLVVLVSWVFFRAADLPSAIEYLSAMTGRTAPYEGAALVSGVIYQPYYLGTFLFAALVTWTFPQTWDWTRRLTAPKAGAILSLFALAVAVLATQAYNPFIYFIF